MKLRIRYNRDKQRKLKSVLVSQHVGVLVYFGIARCNPLDKFSKKNGRDMASTRSSEAYTRYSQHIGIDVLLSSDNIIFADDMLHGCCHVDNIKSLITHFRYHIL